jgi:hypothetical protein
MRYAHIYYLVDNSITAKFNTEVTGSRDSLYMKAAFNNM